MHNVGKFRMLFKDHRLLKTPAKKKAKTPAFIIKL